jgi:hypothetical protein
LAILGFEFKALHLQGRCSTTWAIPPDLFALDILEIGSCFLPRSARSVILLFYASLCSWDDSSMAPYRVFFSVEMWSHKHFCPGWPITAILLILASHELWDDTRNASASNYWLRCSFVNSTLSYLVDFELHSSWSQPPE